MTPWYVNILKRSLPVGTAMFLAANCYGQIPALRTVDGARAARRPAVNNSQEQSRRTTILRGADIQAAPEMAVKKAPAQIAPGAETDLVQERYSDGSVKIAREVTQDVDGNFINHGSWKKWDSRGRVVMEGSYQRNQPHGVWTHTYHEDAPAMLRKAPFNQFSGPFISRATFDTGKLDGSWTIIDGQKRKVMELSFADGKRDGKAVFYFANSRPWREATYREGLIDGEFVQYTPSGDVASRHKYEEGRRIANKTEYYRGDQKQASGVYLHARQVVKTPDNWWNAELATYTPQGKDERHGSWMAWHPNGQVMKRGEYRHDAPAGQFTWWYANGQKSLEGSYKEGEQNGEWTWWHENGLKATIGQYKGGVPVGQWMWWTANGKVAQKADYAEGEGKVIARGEEEQEPAKAGPSLRRAEEPREAKQLDPAELPPLSFQ